MTITKIHRVQAGSKLLNSFLDFQFVPFAYLGEYVIVTDVSIRWCAREIQQTINGVESLPISDNMIISRQSHAETIINKYMIKSSVSRLADATCYGSNQTPQNGE